MVVVLLFPGHLVKAVLSLHFLEQSLRTVGVAECKQAYPQVSMAEQGAPILVETVAVMAVLAVALMPMVLAAVEVPADTLAIVALAQVTVALVLMVPAEAAEAAVGSRLVLVVREVVLGCTAKAQAALAVLATLFLIRQFLAEVVGPTARKAGLGHIVCTLKTACLDVVGNMEAEAEAMTRKALHLLRMKILELVATGLFVSCGAPQALPGRSRQMPI